MTIEEKAFLKDWNLRELNAQEYDEFGVTIDGRPARLFKPIGPIGAFRAWDDDDDDETDGVIFEDNEPVFTQ